MVNNQETVLQLRLQNTFHMKPLAFAYYASVARVQY